MLLKHKRNLIPHEIHFYIMSLFDTSVSKTHLLKCLCFISDFENKNFVFILFLVLCLSCFDSLYFGSITFKLEYLYCTTLTCHFWLNYCYIYSFFHSFFLTGIFFLLLLFLFFATDLFILPSSPPFPHIDFCLPSSVAVCAMCQTHTCACAPLAYSILSARSSDSN